MSVSYFPYPLRLEDLAEFCHPMADHVFALPAYHDGQAMAGNGYILIRAHRGGWMASDFTEPDGAFLMRFQAAPWQLPKAESDGWRSVDEIKQHLFRHGMRGMWLKGKCAPSPVWRVGTSFLARLSHLQMIARLPRCEIHVPGSSGPMYFRFSGGAGMLAEDKKLTEQSFFIFAPRISEITGREFTREKTPAPNLGLPGWPPKGDETETVYD